MARKRNQIFTGIELGTSYIKVAMGEFRPDGTLDLLGAGVQPSQGIVKGEIASAELAQKQLHEALRLAEAAADNTLVQNVVLAVTGRHVATTLSVGNLQIQGEPRSITEADRDAALRYAKGCTLQPKMRIIQCLPRGYTIDDTRHTTDPVNLQANKLQAEVLVVYGDSNTMDSGSWQIREAMGFDPFDLCFSPVAAGLAAFTPETVKKGVLLIDIGGGVTEYAVFHEIGCFYAGRVAVGVDHVMNDLSLGLRLPYVTCRPLISQLSKERAWSVISRADDRTCTWRVADSTTPARQIPVYSVERIVELRLQELFSVILEDLQDKGVLELVGNGVTLCGGGALLPRLDELARSVFEMPVTIGRPQLVNGPKDFVASPCHLVPIGLLHYGRMVQQNLAPAEPPLGTQLYEDLRRVGKAFRETFRF